MGLRLADEKVPWTTELRATARGLALVASAAPVLVGALLLVTIVQGVLPATIVAETGRFLASIPAALDGDADAIGTAREAIVVLAAAIVAGQVLSPLQGAISFGLQRRFQASLSRRLMSSVSSLPGLAYHEDPAFRDKLEVSSWVGWAPVNSVNFLRQVVQTSISLVAMGAVAATYAGWVPVLLFVLTVPEAVAAWRLVARTGWARLRMSDEVRRANYYRRMALELDAAKELRLFGLAGWVLDRQGRHWLEGIREVWRLRRRSLLQRLVLHVVGLGGFGFAFLSMVGATLDGRIDVGRFAAASLGAAGMVQALLGLASAAASLRQANFYLPTALKLLDLPAKAPRLHAHGTVDARSLSKEGVAFEDVTFTYPGTERRILDGLTLRIPTGGSVALVGENGAGKTTLIKLLCRFYDPDGGRITLDGVDLRELDVDTLRSRLAVIFQDFVRYHLSARDNVAFGAAERVDDLDLVVRAAARVGVLEAVEALDDGWDTPLARDFGGADLSGGEWQRIALARAMAAQLGRDADLLVLDEPTASLDVRVEHELYARFAELVRGKTTLLVSHRFSTVRMAERIVFLEAGRVVEDGSHDELMAAGRRYAELYELQAAHFRPDRSSDATSGTEPR